MNTRTLQVVTALTFLVWIGILFGGLYVVWGGLSDARISNRDLNLRIHTIQEKQDKVHEARVVFATLEKDVKLLSDSLLTEDDVLGLLLELERFATATNNEYLVNVMKDEYVSKTKKTSKKPAREEVLLGSVFHIELTGTFDGLYQFLDRVQKLPYVMQIQRMNTSLDIKDDDDIKTSLRIKIFSRI